MEQFFNEVFSVIYDNPIESIQFTTYERCAYGYNNIGNDGNIMYVSCPDIKSLKKYLMTRAIDHYIRFHLVETLVCVRMIMVLYNSGCHSADISYHSIPEVCLKYLKRFPKLIISTTTWTEIMKDNTLSSICDPETNFDVHDANDTRMIHTKDINVFNLAIKLGSKQDILPDDNTDPLKYATEYAMRKIDEIERKLSKIRV